MSQYDSTIFCNRSMTVRLTPAHWFYVYLIHFHSKIGNADKAHGQAGHYLGSTGNLDARLQLHQAGNGAALMRAVGNAGITWEISHLWRFESCEEARAWERRLKKRANNSRECPLCRPGKRIDPHVFARMGHRRLARPAMPRRAMDTCTAVMFVRRSEREVSYAR